MRGTRHALPSVAAIPTTAYDTVRAAPSRGKGVGIRGGGRVALERAIGFWVCQTKNVRSFSDKGT